jgi:hypothetical protein
MVYIYILTKQINPREQNFPISLKEKKKLS